MEQKTHWKKLMNPNYLGSYAFQPNQEMILTIREVKEEMVTGSDGKKEECMVCHFKENIKPLILNTTNSKTIEHIYQTPYIEDWQGKRVQLYVTPVKAFGDTVDAIRIRPKAPPDINQQKPILNESHPDWRKAVAALEEGSATIAALQKRFTIPTEELKNLQVIAHA